MRKKVLTGIILLLLLAFVSSCGVNTRGPLPYGKWESTEPYIIMDINPQNEEFYGVYQQDDEIIDVLITFKNLWKEFDIYNVSDLSKISQPDFYELALLNGEYAIRNNKLYYRVKPYWKEKSGITHTIVFDKIEEYEIPDELL